MNDKPETPQTYKDLAKEWISRLETCVRRRAFTHAHKLFHKKMVWFGLESNVTGTLDQAIQDEFKEVWPFQVAFTVDLAKAAILPGDMITVCAPWSAQSTLTGAPIRQGRVTLCLAIFEGRKVLCVHGHMSRNSK